MHHLVTVESVKSTGASLLASLEKVRVMQLEKRMQELCRVRIPLNYLLRMSSCAYRGAWSFRFR